MAEIDENTVIRFYHGNRADIAAKVTDGTINGSDFVVAKDTDELVFIDSDKNQKPVVSRTQESHTVNIGTGNSVGGIKDGDVITSGTGIDELIELLTNASVAPTYTAPAVVISGANSVNYVEAGSTVTPSLTATFVQNDAGALTTVEVLQDGTSVASSETSPATFSDEVTVPDGTVTFTAKATYAEGTIKNDNTGTASPDGHIEAGSVTSVGSIKYVGQRSVFYGSGTGEMPAVTSEFVRALANSDTALTTGDTFDVTMAEGEQYVAFAYPKTLGEVASVTYVEAGDGSMADSFDQTTISVEGANGFTGTDYYVYTYSIPVAAFTSATFRVVL